MGNSIQIHLDTKDVERRTKQLKDIKDGAPKAIMRALNKAVTGMKTDASNTKTGIASRYTIAQKHFSSKMKLNKASMSDLSISLSARDRGIRSTYFKFKPNENPGVEGAPTVRVQYKKGGSFTKESQKYKTGAFIATMPGNNFTGAFARVSKHKSRGNINVIYGPGVVQMLNNVQIRTAIPEKAQERFDKALDQQIKHLLDKQKG